MKGISCLNLLFADLQYVQVQEVVCTKVPFMVIVTGVGPRRVIARACSEPVREDRRHCANVTDSLMVKLLWVCLGRLAIAVTQDKGGATGLVLTS